MTFVEFDASFDMLLKDCCGMRDTKGAEYANSTDRLANFKEIAAEIGISPEAVCAVYLEKHMRAIKAFAKNGKVSSNEHIRGRIVDAITYLGLLNGLVEEKQSGTQSDDQSEDISSRMRKVGRKLLRARSSRK